MKILIAEDDLVSRRVLQGMLKKAGYEVVTAGTGESAWQLLQQEGAPRLAILDWMMPGMDGVQVCREVRKRNGKNYTYLLLLTARSERQDIIEGLEAGADDYLVKPFNAQELHARLNVGKRILDLHNRLLSLCEQLHVRATRDSLTGIWNRAAILDILDQELARAERDVNSVGLVMADIDHFKRVNDTHGHPAGDGVLRETARAMRALLRPYDSIGRYGGEEFLIVLPGCTAHSAASLAERLRQQVTDHAVQIVNTHIPLTMSFGVTAYEGGNIADAISLLAVADAALYRAKDNGRNRVEFTAAPMPVLSSNRPLLLQNAELNAVASS